MSKQRSSSRSTTFVAQQNASLRLKYLAMELFSIIDQVKRCRYPVETIQELAKALTIVANVEGKLRKR